MKYKVDNVYRHGHIPKLGGRCTMFSPQQRPLSDNLAAATSPATSPALPDCWSGLPTLYLHLMGPATRHWSSGHRDGIPCVMHWYHL